MQKCRKSRIMTIIEKKSFSKNWIIQKSKEQKYDPTLIEKIIYAFELLGSLIDNEINLIFKGGTSLLLLLPGQFKRLSIDLDVIITDQASNLPTLFDQILNKSPFIKWEEDIREKARTTPLKHFKFYYNSSINSREEPVLLDILFLRKSPYLETVKKRITLEFFEIIKNFEVEIPSVESLFADKLTAFAPNTIGIPYGKGRSTEIIKQLFDLGILFYHIKDTREIKTVYKSISKIEAEFRNINNPITSFLEDSFETAFLICQLDFKGSISNKKTEELKDGIKRIRSFVNQGEYNLLNAKEDASMVAFVSYILREGININVERLSNALKDITMENVKDISMSKKFKVLNSLRRISSPSFYLWAIIDKKVKL